MFGSYVCSHTYPTLAFILANNSSHRITASLDNNSGACASAVLRLLIGRLVTRAHPYTDFHGIVRIDTETRL